MFGVYAGVHRFSRTGWVCIGEHWYARLCSGVCRYAWVCAGMCVGWLMNFPNRYILATRVLISADFNTYPIQIKTHRAYPRAIKHLLNLTFSFSSIFLSFLIHLSMPDVISFKTFCCFDDWSLDSLPLVYATNWHTTKSTTRNIIKLFILTKSWSDLWFKVSSWNKNNLRLP